MVTALEAAQRFVSTSSNAASRFSRSGSVGERLAANSSRFGSARWKGRRTFPSVTVAQRRRIS
jgi:hypothetical protein